jgi:sodium transport system ATP-binding protein
MRDRGACVVFSSHVLDEVRALCDHVVIVSRGRLVASGETSDICRQAQCATLEEAFLRLTGYGEIAS